MTAKSQRANPPELQIAERGSTKRRCAVNTEHQDHTGFLASILGLITGLLAVLTQFLRLRKPQLPEELSEQLEDIEEDLDRLENRIEEQEAVVNALQKQEPVPPQ
jgi:hypothetical protein